MLTAKDDSEIPGTVAYEAARADRLEGEIDQLKTDQQILLDIIDRLLRFVPPESGECASIYGVCADIRATNA